MATETTAYKRKRAPTFVSIPTPLVAIQAFSFPTLASSVPLRQLPGLLVSAVPCL